MSAPLRVAVVGAGPAGAYAVERLLQHGPVEVEVLERLLTPWGLVRAGVAPDHQDTKAVIGGFEWTAGHRDVRMHLGVEVGRDIWHADLAALHDAVVYTVGAPEDRRLGIPGEGLPGSHPATAFVAWYNGHPDARDLAFDLSGRRAIVVGNGNVALDIARLLTTDIARLRRTDVADHALDVLDGSAIEEVVVLGRRGAAQAAFTHPELLALTQLPGVDVVVEADPLEFEDSARSSDPATRTDYATSLKLALLRELAVRGEGTAPRRIVLRFLSSPTAIVGDGHTEGLRVARTELDQDVDGRVSARATDDVELLEAGLVLRSIGYRGRPTPGVPFDETVGRIPNDRGAVLDPETGRPVPGLYTAGWVKRGPTGVIGTNKLCAAETIDRLLVDHAEGRLPRATGGAADLDALLRERVPARLGHRDWQRLDEHERRAGRSEGRPRVKVCDPSEMTRIAAAAGPPAVPGP